MDTPNMPTMLETWSALRVAYTDLPAAKIATILYQLDPETAARVQAILTEFDQREAQRKAEIAQQEAASTAAVLATGATAHGTYQQGVAGLTGRVDQHYWRLFGAVFIGGALKGGMTALQTTMTGAAGAGQVASGIASVGNQATNRVIGPLLNTRPTIEVDAGQLCNVLLLQPLHLPAMWQGSDPLITARQPGR